MKIEKKDEFIKWAIFTTGYGKNAMDVLNSYAGGILKHSKIEILVYEDLPCGAFDMANDIGIHSVQVKRTDYASQNQYQHQLLETLKPHAIDYIFLLNFKYKVKDELLKHYPNRIINIHPSLFPSFLGTKTAIQDALDYGVKITGITTHIIDDKLDEGIILEQKAIKIKPKDTFETLYPKFSKSGHNLIIKTIKRIEKKYLAKLRKE